MTDNIIYDETKNFRAVKTDEPAGFFEQEELIWQAQYQNESGTWERLSYYATPEEAIAAARQCKQNVDFINNLFS